MKKSLLYRVNRLLGQIMTGGKCPEILWDKVVRIEAFGTDAVSAFAIVVTFRYADGSAVAVHPEQKGYYKIIEALDQRFPAIPSGWFEEMRVLGKEPFDVERVLYSRPSEGLST
jgi:hypothetical protein